MPGFLSAVVTVCGRSICSKSVQKDDQGEHSGFSSRTILLLYYFSREAFCVVGDTGKPELVTRIVDIPENNIPSNPKLKFSRRSVRCDGWLPLHSSRRCLVSPTWVFERP